MKLHASMIGLLTCAAIAAGCGGKEERLKTHLERGRALYAESDYDRAGVEVRNVLQIDPRSAEAYYLSAQIWEKRSEFQKAFSNYAKSLELDPGNLEARARMGRFYLAGGDAAKAAAVADELLAADPGNADGRVLKAALLARRDKFDEAVSMVREVLKTAPGHMDGSALLASLLTRNADPAEARAVLVASVERNPREIDPRLALASVLERLKDIDGAAAQRREIVALAPKNFDHRVALARFLARNGRLPESEQVLREAIAADPEDEKRYLVLVEQTAAAKGFDAAEKLLREFIAQKPKAHELRFGLAAMLLGARRPADAAAAYEEVVRIDRLGPKGLQARGQLARLHLAEGRGEDVDRLVEEILRQNPRDNAALMIRAQRRLAADNTVDAIADLRAVLRDQPDSIELTSLLARAHQANNEPELAREALTRAVSLYPKRAPFRYLLASYLASQKDYAGALREVDSVLRERADDAQALAARAEIQQAAGDVAGAEATLKRLVTLAPEAPAGHLRLARFYVAQKKNAAALAQLEAAAAGAPRDPEILAALVRTLYVEKKTDRALAVLKQAAAAQPEQAQVLVMYGEALLAQKKPAEAAKSFQRAMEIQPGLEAARSNLARLHLNRREFSEAERLLKEGLQVAPRSVALRLQLAELHQYRESPDLAIAEYEAILAFAPGQDVAANNLASLLADTRSDRPSMERALALSKRFERSPNALYLDTLGWSYYRLGDYARAVEVLRRAADGLDAPLIHYHLGMALHRAGDAEKAKVHLRKAAAAEVAFPGRSEARALVNG